MPFLEGIVGDQERTINTSIWSNRALISVFWRVKKKSIGQAINKLQHNTYVPCF